jgi:hypothetical protein
MPATGGHHARAYFAQRPSMCQRPHPIPYEFLNQIAPATPTGSDPKGPFILVVLRHLKRRVRHIIMRTHDSSGEPRVIFDFSLRNIEPVVPPVAPLISGTRDQLHILHRSLPRLRRESARSELRNFVTNPSLLPVQTIVLGEDLHRRLTAIRRCCLDILRQRHHGVRCQLMNLDPKLLQHLRHETMRRQTKSGNKKCLKHNQFTLGSGISSAPGTRPTPPPKYPNCCISCSLTTSAKHQTPLYLPGAIPPPHRPRDPRKASRPLAWSQQTKKRTTWLRTVDGGARSASRGPVLRRTGARRADEQASNLNKEG